MSQIKLGHKSEILFLYETTYNVPNGDPFTGEQRYDEETKKILVSDVRMKRFVRDYLASIGKNIYVVGDKSNAEGKESGSASRLRTLKTETFKDALEEATKKAKSEKQKDFSDARFVMKKCIDVRLFGGISTEKGDAVNLTGPVQFGLLNPSLNSVNLRMHQNTSVFVSSAENSQGAIGTTTLVPYSMMQIHGWVNPQVAANTEMTEGDLTSLFEGLWYGTGGEGSSHSRSKVGQNSILLIEVVYSENKKKVYGLDRLIQINPKNGKKDEEIRSMDDYLFDFESLFVVSKSDKISSINYYTEIEEIAQQFDGREKFNKIEL